VVRGEKFTWFRNPSGRPSKRQWQALREQADRVIAGELDLESRAFQDLIDSMISEMQWRQYRNDSLDQSEDLLRVQKLAEVFQAKGHKQRIEPFDSLADGLEGDRLAGAGEQLRSLAHTKSRMGVREFRKASVELLRAIKGEHWQQMSGETRKRWTESYKVVNYHLLLRLVLLVTFLLVVVGLVIYKGWVHEGQYKYFQDNPEWLWVFAAYDLLVTVLLVAVIVSYVRRRRRGLVDQMERPVS
jgi:hypothetical protein